MLKVADLSFFSWDCYFSWAGLTRLVAGPSFLFAYAKHLEHFGNINL